MMIVASLFTEGEDRVVDGATLPPSEAESSDSPEEPEAAEFCCVTVPRSARHSVLDVLAYTAASLRKVPPWKVRLIGVASKGLPAGPKAPLS